MGRRRDPVAQANAYVTGMTNATGKIEEGIRAVTEAPGAKAAKKQDKMLRGITESVQSGRWGKAVANVSLEEWQEKTINKGLARIATGADAARSKVEQFATNQIAAQDQIDRALEKMPDDTLEQRVAKMVFQVKSMAGLKGTLKP